MIKAPQPLKGSEEEKGGKQEGRSKISLQGRALKSRRAQLGGLEAGHELNSSFTSYRLQC